MGTIATGAFLFAAFLLILAVLAWQGARRSADADPVEYLIDDAAEFVYSDLSPGAAERLGKQGTRLVLEWQLHYQQVIAPRGDGLRPVVGSGEAMEYVLARAEEAGRDIDPVDVAEVMAAEIGYLLSIGAVGPPVGEGS